MIIRRRDRSLKTTYLFYHLNMIYGQFTQIIYVYTWFFGIMRVY